MRLCASCASLICLVLSLPLSAGSTGGCQPKEPYPSGLHHLALHVGDTERRFNLYVPRAAHRHTLLPIVLLLPGNGNDPDDFFKFPDLLAFSERSPFLIVELIGESNQFNVELESLAQVNRPDDVAYTKAVLHAVMGPKLCVDPRRVFCLGMSRGGRMCVRLASEMAESIAAMAIVSGLRYPHPNHATREMPIIAFHGTHDNTDPYIVSDTYKAPQYWGSMSVPESAAKWARFNNCRHQQLYKDTPNSIITEVYKGCRNGADVVLVTIQGAEHAWPGTDLIYGPFTHRLNVTSQIWTFFSKHRLPDPHGVVALSDDSSSASRAAHAAVPSRLPQVERDSHKSHHSDQITVAHRTSQNGTGTHSRPAPNNVTVAVSDASSLASQRLRGEVPASLAKVEHDSQQSGQRQQEAARSGSSKNSAGTALAAVFGIAALAACIIGTLLVSLPLLMNTTTKHAAPAVIKEGWRGAPTIYAELPLTPVRQLSRNEQNQE